MVVVADKKQTTRSNLKLTALCNEPCSIALTGGRAALDAIGVSGYVNALMVESDPDVELA